MLGWLRRVRAWGLFASALALAFGGCGSRSGLDGLLPANRVELAIAPPGDGLTSGVGSSGCVDITRRYNSVPATVLLLIDQSQSMSFAFGESTRWDVLRQAIVDPEEGLLASLDPGARVGLMLYTGQGGFANAAGCPLLTRVDVEFDNVEAVRRAYLAAEPMRGGDTPTGESIEQATLALGAIDSVAPKYILLATDGEPDTCAQPKPQEGLPQAVEAARGAFDQGIRLFALGVSDSLGVWRLQQMANAGAGKDPSLVYGQDAQAEPPLSASSEPRELAEQLKGIIGDARSCVVELGNAVRADRALDGRLVLDGEVLGNDARNGWTLLDPETVEIHGAACEKILRDGERLDVRFPCTGETPDLR